MQNEHPIWKILTLLFAALTIITSLWIHFDTKRSTEEKIVQALSDRYIFVDKEMSYEQALEALDKDIKELENDIKNLKEKNKSKDKEITTLQKDLLERQERIDAYSDIENIHSIIDQATDYWSSNSYSQALVLLRDSENLSDDIATLYKQYSTEYCAIIIKQADALIASRRIDDAKSLIDSNIAIVKDSSPLKTKLKEVENKKPVKLSSLKSIASRNYYEIDDSGATDTIGNIYSSNNGFILKAEGEHNYGYSTFYLGGKYKSFSTTISVSDESENRSDSDLSGWIGIYKKDDEGYSLIKRVDNITRLMTPVVIEDIDVSGIEWLEIRYFNNDEYFSIAGGFHSLEIIVSGGMLYP